MRRIGALATLAILASSAALPGSAAATSARKRQTLPIGGNAAGNFSIARQEVRRGAHGSLKATFAVPATTGGPVIVATPTHPPTHHAIAYVFAGSPSAQTTPANGTWTFRTPVAFYGGQIAPQVLTSSFDNSHFCRALPGGAIPTGRLTVRASAGPSIAGLTPLQTITQALDITCKRSGGEQLAAAFGR